MGSLIVPIISEPPFSTAANSVGCKRRNRLTGIFTSGLFNPCVVDCLSHFSKYCANVSGIFYLVKFVLVPKLEFENERIFFISVRLGKESSPAFKIYRVFFII